METDESGELRDEGWATLLERISDGKCTPFLGTGVNGGFLPSAKAVANEWAKELHYPFRNSNELDKVAEYLAVQRGDPMAPKDKFVRLLRSALDSVDESKLNDFLTASDQFLSVAADLPLPAARPACRCQPGCGSFRFGIAPAATLGGSLACQRTGLGSCQFPPTPAHSTASARLCAPAVAARFLLPFADR